jgi:prephenate dehydratase
MKIVAQGKLGSYSEMAVREFYPEDEVIPMDLPEDVCRAVESGDADMALLPVENSIIGNVTLHTDLIYRHKLYAIGEHFFKIHHCLLAQPGTTLDQIKLVRSHPVALGQCQRFIDKMGWQAEPEFDTAGASELLSKKDNCHTEATISSSLSADCYGLSILSKNIQNVEHNYTRFLALVHADKVQKISDATKTSLAFTIETDQEAGSLVECLQTFSSHDVSLSKIESRPIEEDPFSYIFFADALAGLQEDNMQTCMTELKRLTKEIKVLGSYPKGVLS